MKLFEPWLNCTNNALISLLSHSRPHHAPAAAAPNALHTMGDSEQTAAHGRRGLCVVGKLLT